MSETAATDPDDARLVAGLWRVVARHGWAGLTMGRVSAASGVPLAELRRRCPTPFALLALHGRVTDQQVLAGTVPDSGDSPRERLFDVLMRRVDVLQPHRRGVLRLMDEAALDPFLGLPLLAALPGSMAWMLEAARIGTDGFGGALRANGLVAVWLYTLRAWARDATEDLGATMAALDRALDRAEQAARTIGLRPADRAGEGPARSPTGIPAAGPATLAT
jgi:ubiquinone biosynthesis protein COQ9